jgi:hypothetical protein
MSEYFIILRIYIINTANFNLNNITRYLLFAISNLNNITDTELRIINSTKWILEIKEPESARDS